MARVYVSGVIDAPVDRVWALARDFNGLADWHPAIADSEIEDGRSADSVGCVRSFHLTDGGHLREKLVALDDGHRAVTYTILVSPMPIENYVATLRLTPVTEGDRTFAEWWADFDVSAEDEPGVRKTVGRGVFAAGIEALAERA